jgi:hypothetical protein
MNQAELSTTLAASINTAHAECMACDDDIRTVVLKKINKARECGIFLMEAKAQCGHGKWLKWVADNLRFGEGMALAYMRFATANPQPVEDLDDGIRCLKDAMIASGALSAPSGHGQQQRSAHTWLDRIALAAGAVARLVNEHREKSGDVATWTAEERAAAKAQLDPLVKVWEAL